MQTFSPDSFYAASLDANAVKREHEDLTKLASKEGVDLKVAELAKTYFERLTFDGVAYATESDQATDAIKMAKAYFEHEDAVHAEAKKLADVAAKVLGDAARELMKTAGAEGVSVSDLLTAAALQLEGQAKTATSANDLAAAGHAVWTDPATQNVQTLHPHIFQAIGQRLDPSLEPRSAAEFGARYLGIDPTDKKKAYEHAHNILLEARATPDQPLHSVAAAYHARTSAPNEADWSKVYAGGADPAMRHFGNWLPTAGEHLAEVQSATPGMPRADAHEFLGRKIGLDPSHPEFQKVLHNASWNWLNNNPGQSKRWTQFAQEAAHNAMHPPSFMQQHQGKFLAGAGAAAGLGGLYMLGSQMHEQNKEKKHRDIVNAYRLTHGLPPIEA